MIYNTHLKMDDDGRLLECPRCKNEEFSKGAKFCRICGLPLFNRCTDDSCEAVNPANARFCEFCGEATLFNVWHLLRPYDEEDPEEISETGSSAECVSKENYADDELPF